MNFFQEALASKRSTIIYGPFGRYPFLVKFYIEAIPELESVSEYELIFWYRNRGFLYIFLEPPFEAFIPSDKWCIVLTSHLRLQWNPLTTRLVQANLALNKSIPLPETLNADFRVVIPPTSHLFNFLGSKPVQIDLSAVDNTHEAYLRFLTLFDVLRPTSQWCLRISDTLRKKLLKDIPDTGPYDVHLQKVLR